MARDLLTSTVMQSSIKDISRASRADWMSLGNAHILLTSGTGFFGSWMIASFAAARSLGLPIEMTVLSRDPELFLQMHPSLRTISGLTFRKGDVTSATIPFSISHIVHLAMGETDGASGDSPIVAGTKHILAEAKRVGTTRLLLASSGAVYGNAPLRGDGNAPLRGGGGREYSDTPIETAIHADARLAATGIANRAAELLCREVSAARDLETVIARGFDFCGPLFPVDSRYVISTFMSAMLNGLPIHVKTPNAVRSFLDGRDLAIAFWRLLARGRSGEAYNVGSDESVTMAELADLFRAVAWKQSLQVPEIRMSGVMQGADIFRPSIAKIRTELGWRPTVSLRESLLSQAQWALEPSMDSNDNP